MLRVRPLEAVSEPMAVKVELAGSPAQGDCPAAGLEGAGAGAGVKVTAGLGVAGDVPRAPALLRRWTPLVVRLPAVRAKSPAVMVSPPAVMVRPLPMVAAFWTLKPVPAPLMSTSPLKVLVPAKVWAPVLTRPTLVPSAVCRIRLLPEMTAPSALLGWESIVPMVSTPGRWNPGECHPSRAVPDEADTLPAAMVTPQRETGLLANDSRISMWPVRRRSGAALSESAAGSLGDIEGGGRVNRRGGRTDSAVRRGRQWRSS